MAEHDEQLSAEDAQLIDELREQYSRTRARSGLTLARAWERIQQGQQPADARTFRNERVATLVPLRNEIKGKSHMKDRQPISKKPGRLGRTLNVFVAAALLTVVVGSLILAYSHFRPQNSTGSGIQGTATVASSPQAGASTPSTQSSQTPTDSESSRNWPVGQSTYWANFRYHQLTGYWVSWDGNANQWVDGARANGWDVSQTPHVPSIIVLMPYVQGAPSTGHVAVVESLVSSTTAQTSNMNWNSEGGGWDIVSYADFTIGTGVYFIWHP